MSKPDWEAIESAYRAGLMSVREIASPLDDNSDPAKWVMLHKSNSVQLVDGLFSISEPAPSKTTK